MVAVINYIPEVMLGSREVMEVTADPTPVSLEVTDSRTLHIKKKHMRRVKLCTVRYIIREQRWIITVWHVIWTLILNKTWNHGCASALVSLRIRSQGSDDQKF